MTQIRQIVSIWIQEKQQHLVFIICILSLILITSNILYLATLILIDGGVEINAENIEKLLTSAKCEIDPSILRVQLLGKQF